jgi:riboflavin synthase
MFTGIIEQVGTIQKIDGNKFTIGHSFDEDFCIGESVAVNGACMTVLEQSQSTFTVEIMEESRNRTVFGEAREDDEVNLERSARIGERNSGHNVTGHIDQMGKIVERKEVADFWLFRIGMKKENQKLVVEKGSIAVDGISLTLSGVSTPGLNSDWFEVSILPYTLEQTNLKTKNVGDNVNIEFDILGKYVVNLQSSIINLQ